MGAGLRKVFFVVVFIFVFVQQAAPHLGPSHST